MSINSIVTAVAAYYAIGWVLDMLIQGGSLKISPDAAMAVQKTDDIIGKPAAPIGDLEYYQGSPVTLGNGKVTVVEFWATWCPPCRKAIQHLNTSYTKYKTRGVEFIGITNETKQVIKKYKDDKQPFPTYPIGLDYSNCCKAYPREGIPAAFVVGKDGTIQWQGHPMGGLDAAIEAALAAPAGVSSDVSRNKTADKTASGVASGGI